MLAGAAVIHWWEILESLTKTAALLGAGGFFLWKAVSGANNPNLAVAVTADRAPVDGSDHEDVVGITVSLNRKGALTALRLHGIAVRALEPTANPPGQLCPIRAEMTIDTTRQQTNGGDGDTLATLEWKSLEHTAGIYVVPGDEMTFAHAFKVPRNRACVIDVVAFGKGPYMATVMQWRASTVSLPRSR